MQYLQLLVGATFTALFCVSKADLTTSFTENLCLDPLLASLYSLDNTCPASLNTAQIAKEAAMHPALLPIPHFVLSPQIRRDFEPDERMKYFSNGEHAYLVYSGVPFE